MYYMLLGMVQSKFSDMTPEQINITACNVTHASTTLIANYSAAIDIIGRAPYVQFDDLPSCPMCGGDQLVCRNDTYCIPKVRDGGHCLLDVDCDSPPGMQRTICMDNVCQLIPLRYFPVLIVDILNQTLLKPNADAVILSTVHTNEDGQNDGYPGVLSTPFDYVVVPYLEDRNFTVILKFTATRLSPDSQSQECQRLCALDGQRYLDCNEKKVALSALMEFPTCLTENVPAAWNASVIETREMAVFMFVCNNTLDVPLLDFVNNLTAEFTPQCAPENPTTSPAVPTTADIVSTSSIELRTASESPRAQKVSNTTESVPSTTKEAVKQPVVNRTCINRHRCCDYWANMGECVNNSGYMLSYCRRACRRCVDSSMKGTTTCTDYLHDCKLWSKLGECHANPFFMEENCQASCKTCGRQARDMVEMCRGRVEKGGCIDSSPDCVAWARRGECDRRAWWMGVHCKRACGLC